MTLRVTGHIKGECVFDVDVSRLPHTNKEDHRVSTYMIENRVNGARAFTTHDVTHGAKVLAAKALAVMARDHG